MKPMSTKSRAGQLRRAIRDALFVAAIAAGAPALAIDFQNESGTVSGSWDTTLTYGYSWRVESRDERLIATSASPGPVPWPGLRGPACSLPVCAGLPVSGPYGGLGRSPNIDDGNLNFYTGTVSNAVKFRPRSAWTTRADLASLAARRGRTTPNSRTSRASGRS